MGGTVRVTFLRPPGGYRDRIRAYRLIIDDTFCGKIKRGGQVSVDVEPGEHVARAVIDWTGSPPVAFTAVPGEPVWIRVAPAGNSLQVWQAWTTTRYLELTLLPPVADEPGPGG
ncbi:hypothetical protein [Actinomadura sp. NPDC048394]|uniref:hypothetical protein n=1 Tax=Actinomadura sp. NPDC048394 TaxID=3158223 RepID=UPI0033CC7FFD